MGASQLLPISLGIHLLAGYAIRRGLYRRTVDAGGRFRGVFSSASANVICRSGPRWATSNLHGWRAKPRCWLQLQRLCTALMLHQTYATPGAIANDRFRVNTALQTYKSHLPIRSHREDRAVNDRLSWRWLFSERKRRRYLRRGQKQRATLGISPRNSRLLLRPFRRTRRNP